MLPTPLLDILLVQDHGRRGEAVGPDFEVGQEGEPEKPAHPDKNGPQPARHQPKVQVGQKRPNTHSSLK